MSPTSDRAKTPEKVAILGPGKVGTAVARLLGRSGFEIAAVAARSMESARRAAAFTGGEPTTDFVAAARRADCVFITTSDDAVRAVCESLAGRGGVVPGMKVVHTSGAGGLDLLASARDRGAFVACIHPLQTFADVESAIGKIPGSTFGITADEGIRDWTLEIVAALGGKPFFVPEEDKALYHAAACVASNYFVTLMYLVEEMYARMGLGRGESLEAFWPLVKGTIGNIESKSTIPSLTGPIARGDAGTVRKHLQVIRDRMPELLAVYREMGMFTADVAGRKGTLRDEKREEIRTILKGGRET